MKMKLNAFTFRNLKKVVIFLLSTWWIFSWAYFNSSNYDFKNDSFTFFVLGVLSFIIMLSTILLSLMNKANRNKSKALNHRSSSKKLLKILFLLPISVFLSSIILLFATSFLYEKLGADVDTLAALAFTGILFIIFLFVVMVCSILVGLTILLYERIRD